MKSRWFFLFAVIFAMVQSMGCQAEPPDRPAESVESLLSKANQLLAQKKPKEALALATKAAELEPKNPRAVYFRGRLYDDLGQFDKALADFDKAIALDPKAADAYNFRGMVQFKLGKITESIADFDKFLELRPEATPEHWQRGISYYYAGRYEDGRKQFERYEAISTNDVENAVWRYLCMARSVGVDKARAGLLKIGNDRRVPMMEVYALFAGKVQPADVLRAAEAGRPSAEELNMRLFYTHLYLALYYEAAGDKKLAQEHMTKAALDHKVNGYMWETARVHLAIMRKAK